MKRSLFPFALIIFLSACNPTQKILHGGNLLQTSFTEKIPFTFEYGIPFITVSINGKPYNFMFDTGAATIISPEIAKTFDLKSSFDQKVIDSQGASNKQQFIKIPSIKIGKLSFENIGAAVIESSDVFEFKCMKFDGIIGANLMAKAIWQIDYQNKILTATNNLANLEIPTTSNIIPFIPVNTQKTPSVAIKIGNKTKHVTFDTGSNGDFNLGVKSYQSEISTFESAESIGITSIGIYGSGKSSFIKYVKVPVLEIGDIMLTNQIIDFSEQSSNTLGNLFFKNYKVILNWKENRIYMIKEKDYNVEKLQTFGLSLKYINNKPRVIEIYQKSEAEKLGVLINDELLTLNGKDLSQLNDEQACFYAFNSILNTNENSINLTLLRAGEKINLTLKKTTLLE